MRAARATIVVPALFAIAYKVIGNPQVALFATFGGIRDAGHRLIRRDTRRDKLVAHMGLAIVGSLALIIGTLVSGTTWLAALVTVPVTFAIFFGGIVGPNAASGTIAAMFAYVLPVVSAGGAAMIPSRLEGWWMASVAGTIAVLLFSPAAPGNRLRAAAAELAAELADRLRAAADGETTNAGGDARGQGEAAGRVHRRAVPPDRACHRRPGAWPAWCSCSSGARRRSATRSTGTSTWRIACQADRELLRVAAELFADTRALLTGQAADPDFAALEKARANVGGAPA